MESFHCFIHTHFALYHAEGQTVRLAIPDCPFTNELQIVSCKKQLVDYLVKDLILIVTRYFDDVVFYSDEEIVSIETSPNGRYIFVVEQGKVGHLIDLLKGKKITTLKSFATCGFPSALLELNGKQKFVYCPNAQEIKLLDIESREIEATMHDPDYHYGPLKVSPDGRSIITSGTMVDEDYTCPLLIKLENWISKKDKNVKIEHDIIDKGPPYNHTCWIDNDIYAILIESDDDYEDGIFSFLQIYGTKNVFEIWLRENESPISNLSWDAKSKQFFVLNNEGDIYTAKLQKGSFAKFDSKLPPIGAHPLGGLLFFDKEMYKIFNPPIKD